MCTSSWILILPFLLLQDVDGPTGRLLNVEDDEDAEYSNSTTIGYDEEYYNTDGESPPKDLYRYHPWGIFFTIIGTVLLDFDADACQSPSRAYLLDVTLPGQFNFHSDVSWVNIGSVKHFHLFPFDLFLCRQ